MRNKFTVHSYIQRKRSIPDLIQSLCNTEHYIK